MVFSILYADSCSLASDISNDILAEVSMLTLSCVSNIFELYVKLKLMETDLCVGCVVFSTIYLRLPVEGLYKNHWTVVWFSCICSLICIHFNLQK